MEPQLINNFAAAEFCAFKDFGTSSEGDCNTELIRIAIRSTPCCTPVAESRRKSP